MWWARLNVECVWQSGTSERGMCFTVDFLRNRCCLNYSSSFHDFNHILNSIIKDISPVAIFYSVLCLSFEIPASGRWSAERVGATRMNQSGINHFLLTSGLFFCNLVEILGFRALRILHIHKRAQNSLQNLESGWKSIYLESGCGQKHVGKAGALTKRSARQ